MIVIIAIILLILLLYNVKNNMSSYPKEEITLVTPSIRPQNLKHLYLQIKNMAKRYPNIRTRWIVVYDGTKNYKQFNDKFVKEYNLYDPRSVKGNAQRNLAFTKIKSGWIYLLDDDTNLIETLFQLINEGIEKNKIHSFTCNANNIGDNVELDIGSIDSGCFLFHNLLLNKMPYALDENIGMCCNDGRLAQRLGNIADHQHHMGRTPFEWNSYNQ